MKNKIISKLAMYDSIIAAMDKHLTVWQHMKALTDTNNDFVRNYKKLSNLKKEAEYPLSPLVEMHMQKREALVAYLSPVIDVVSLYLIDTRDKRSSKFEKLQGRKLKNISDRKLVKLAESIRKISQDKTGNDAPDGLASYGLSGEKLEKLSRQASDFFDSEKEVGKAWKKKSKAKKVLKILIIRNEKILKNRMDKFVRLIREDHPAFYTDYMNARRPSKEKTPKKVTGKAAPAGPEKDTARPKAKPAQKTAPKKKAVPKA